MNYWFCNQSDLKVFDLKVNKNSKQLYTSKNSFIILKVILKHLT